MATKAPRICTCGRVVPAGERCACSMARKAAADKRRPSARERGYNARWERERKAFLKQHPTCCRCGAPADTVDHKEPHRGNAALFWDRSNWAAMCRPCHSSGKQAEERQQAPRRWYDSADAPRGPSGIF